MLDSESYLSRSCPRQGETSSANHAVEPPLATQIQTTINKKRKSNFDTPVQVKKRVNQPSIMSYFEPVAALTPRSQNIPPNLQIL